MLPPILSYIQTQAIIEAHENRQTELTVSLDLALTTASVHLTAEGVYLTEGIFLTWTDLHTIHQAESGCFLIEADGPRKIQTFSEADNKVYTLMPTQGAPTMLISGISMHRIKGVDPQGDARHKAKAIAPLTGQVLDTATGLGYTAIAAAKTAAHVTTIEISPASLEIARLNPWSQPLFNNPKITQIVGDSFEEVEQFADGQFDRILHDPPSFSMAGELYSGEFYRQLYRILARQGRLYHYVGDLESKSGRNTAIATGAMRRLQEAGFKRVARRGDAFGLVGYK